MLEEQNLDLTLILKPIYLAHGWICHVDTNSDFYAQNNF